MAKPFDLDTSRSAASKALSMSGMGREVTSRRLKDLPFLPSRSLILGNSGRPPRSDTAIAAGGSEY